MTEQQILEIKAARQAIDNCYKQHRTVLFNLKQAEQRLLDKCDHKNPDGTTAIVGSFFSCDCIICGWSDL